MATDHDVEARIAAFIKNSDWAFASGAAAFNWQGIAREAKEIIDELQRQLAEARPPRESMATDVDDLRLIQDCAQNGSANERRLVEIIDKFQRHLVSCESARQWQYDRANAAEEENALHRGHLDACRIKDQQYREEIERLKQALENALK